MKRFFAVHFPEEIRPTDPDRGMGKTWVDRVYGTAFATLREAREYAAKEAARHQQQWWVLEAKGYCKPVVDPDLVWVDV